jgi:hypothetical protein
MKKDEWKIQSVNEYKLNKLFTAVANMLLIETDYIRKHAPAFYRAMQNEEGMEGFFEKRLPDLIKQAERRKTEYERTKKPS